MPEIIALYLGKLLGALMIAGIYDWIVMNRLWQSRSLTLAEYKWSFRRGRWLTVLAVAMDVFFLLESSPAPEQSRNELAIFLVMLVPLLIHALFAMRDIGPPEEDRSKNS